MRTTFTIPGNPLSKGRPRTFVHKGTGKVTTMTPKRTMNYQGKVAWCAKEAGVEPITDGPVLVQIDFFMARPKRLYRKKDPSGPVLCDRRPDLDNLGKAILDGLDGIAWRDDGQVAQKLTAKWYHEKNGAPRAVVTVAALGNEEE